MKRLLCTMLLAYSSAAMACDVCGASGGSQGLGLLPQFYRHFVGVQYQYRNFSSRHPSLFEGRPDEKSDEYYHTTQVWGRVNIANRVQVFAFVPYQYNLRSTDTGSAHFSGIGDISVLCNAVVVKTPDSSDAAIKHMLLAGAGIKAPTGLRKTASANDGVLNIQPGTGSWDVLFNANYTIRCKKTGINLEGNYTITTANKDDYKYGNRLGLGIQAFYWLQAGKWSVLPQAGMRLDYILHDYDNYSRKWLNEQTGGNILYANAGAQAYMGRLGLQCSYYIPVSQHYAAGYAKAKQRVEAGFLVLF